MLGMILAFLFFIVSPFGLLALMAGIAGYGVSPLVYRITGVGKVLAHFPLWLTTTMMGRASIVVTEHNDLLLKKMRFDDNGVEKMSFGGMTKEFEDPDNSLHTWKGMAFALADEVHGVLFDPRHAAAGRRKHQADQRGEGVVPTTPAEWKQLNISEWVRGVFEFPKRHELANLSDVRYLIGGGERSENPEQVEDIYKHSRDPLKNKSGLLRYMVPVGAFLLVFGGMFAISTQMKGGGGSSTTVGQSALFALIGTGGLLSDRAKEVLKLAVLSLIPLAVLGFLFTTFGLVATVMLTLVFLIGFFLIPAFALFSRLSATLADIMARLLMLQGLFAYDRPVFEWTPRKYRLREYRNLENPNDVCWYGFAGSLVGFTFEPTPDSWDAEHVENDKLEEMKMNQVATDGGKAQSYIPPGYEPLSVRERGKRGAFGPKNVKDDHYYLHSGRLLERFKNAANGEKSMRRLTESKREHGESAGLSDKALLYSTVAMAAFGGLLGAGVFFVL